MSEQYYLNNNTLHHCVRIPPKVHDYFLIKNYLSELRTDEEREIARRNLGVTVLLEQLRTLINTKVIDKGGVPWDTEPTLGNFGHAVDSNDLYRTFQNYYNKEDIDRALLEINRAIEGKIHIDVDIITELPSETIEYNQIVTYQGIPVQQVQWLDNQNKVHTTYITLDGYYDYISTEENLVFNVIYQLGNLPNNLVCALSNIVDIKRYLNEGSVLPKSNSYVYQGRPLEVHRIDISDVTFNEGYSENIVGFVAFVVRRKITVQETYNKEFPNVFIYKAEWNQSNTIEDVDLIYYKTLTDHSTLTDSDKELISLLGCTKATHEYGGLMTAEDKTNIDNLSENAITKIDLSPLKESVLHYVYSPEKPCTYVHDNNIVEYRKCIRTVDNKTYLWLVFLVNQDPLNPIFLAYRNEDPSNDYYCKGYYNKDGSMNMEIIPDWMYSLFFQDTSMDVFNIFTEETDDENMYATDQDVESLFNSEAQTHQSSNTDEENLSTELATDEEIQSLFD